MGSGVELVRLDGSDIPDAAWQSSMKSIAQGHRVSLITADGMTFDVNSTDLTLAHGHAVGGGTEPPQAVVERALPIGEAVGSRSGREANPYEPRLPPDVRKTQPQQITIIQEDGTQQTINVVQVGHICHSLYQAERDLAYCATDALLD